MVGDTKKAMSIYINELVYDLKGQGKQITTLSLGEAFFKLPRPDFSEYEVDDLVHYTSSRGYPKLLSVLSATLNSSYGLATSTNNLMITSGSKIAIFMALLYARNESSKKVAIIEPAWLSYNEQVKLTGCVPEFFGKDFSIKGIIDQLSDQYCAVILNNPNNPQGNRYSSDELETLVKHCKEKSITLIVDEAYSDFLVSGEHFCSAARWINENDKLIVVNSLSKNLGMSGFRIGYAIASNWAINQLIKLNQHLITCAPTILQVYVADNLESILASTKSQIQNVMIKRTAAVNHAKNIGLEPLEGDSTFYFLIKISNMEQHNFDFCLKLLLHDKISIVPGISYGESCAGYARISIGTETLDQVIAALNKIRERISHGWTDNRDADTLLSDYNLPHYE